MLRFSAIFGAVAVLLWAAAARAQYPPNPGYPPGPMPPGYAPPMPPGYPPGPMPMQQPPGYPPGSMPMQQPPGYPPGPMGMQQPPGYPPAMPPGFAPPGPGFAPPGFIPPPPTVGNAPWVPNPQGPGFFTSGIPVGQGMPPMPPPGPDGHGPEYGQPPDHPPHHDGEPDYGPSAPAPAPAESGGLPLGDVTNVLQPPYEKPYARFWVNAEYLLWLYREAPLPTPVVSRNNDPFTIAALNEGGTQVVYGAGVNSPRYNPAAGGRFNLGFWFDYFETFGIEGSAMLLERVASGFVAESDGFPAPVVAIPFFATEPFNFNPAGETSLNSGGAPSRITAQLSTRLWGAEVNGLMDFMDSFFARLVFLGGFRYVDLNDGFTLTDTFFDTSNGGTVVVQDRFETRNQFFGGQVGAKAEFAKGPWSISAIGKFAIGPNHQTLSIFGDATTTNSAFGLPTGKTAGGVFAQPSNIGTFKQDITAFVPEGQAQIGYLLGPYARLFAGYNFLYMNRVIRAGAQLDRNVNPTQNALFGGGVLVGAPSPVPAFNITDFWAHGINVGLELRY